MVKCLSIFAVALTSVSLAFAAQTKTSRKITSVSTASATDASVVNDSTLYSQISYQSPIAAQGVRVSLLKPSVEVELKASYYGQTASASDKIDDALGFSIGYVKMPIRDIGFTTNLSYFNYHDSQWSANLVRIDGNLAYAFNDKINAKAGINMSKFTSGRGFDELDASIGLQLGVGLQVTPVVGVDVSYAQMNQSGTVDRISYDAKESGLEIGLNGTF